MGCEGEVEWASPSCYLGTLPYTPTGYLKRCRERGIIQSKRPARLSHGKDGCRDFRGCQMVKTLQDYAYHAQLHMPYEQALARVKSALKAEGFGVMTEVDVRATIKEKLGVDSPNYAILGACNPPLAHKALTAEPEIGLLLPCNVIVYERDGVINVSIIDPVSMMEMVQNPELEPVAQAAKERLQRVAASLRAG